MLIDSIHANEEELTVLSAESLKETLESRYKKSCRVLSSKEAR